MYQHILVPIDAAPVGDLAARHAFCLARLLGSRVTLAHLPGDEARCQARLDELARLARRPPTLVLLEPGQPPCAALRVLARQGNNDLLIVELGFLPELRAHAELPLLALPPAAGEPRQARWLRAAGAGERQPGR